MPITAEDMTPYQRIIRAFQIFDRYDDGTYQSVNAQHDEMWAGPDPAAVRAEDIEELGSLGWTPGDDSFHHFT